MQEFGIKIEGEVEIEAGMKVEVHIVVYGTATGHANRSGRASANPTNSDSMIVADAIPRVVLLHFYSLVCCSFSVASTIVSF